MPIRGVSYVQLLVEDWQMALEFYRDLVGLPVDQLVEEMPRRASFELDGAHLEICEGGIGAPHPKGADRNAFVPNIECDDLAATVADLEGRGVPFITPLAESDGYRTATFVDPEGNRMQLFEWVQANE